LFAVYGTSYGPVDGSTTFNLPNYKDYFLRGFDASGTDAASRTDRGDGTTGASVGTKQAGDYLSHTHTGTTTSDGAQTILSSLTRIKMYPFR
jgi:microcystin-dependent protein